jgi:peptide chain release factor 3
MAHESKRRRTFAIISHPDAGKTTLTEKLLLYGGAIHAAGAVKSRKAARAATSDWMEIERKRGISVTSSAMAFELGGIRYNLLDTPGHQDFSEDTYRTLTAADCAVMLIDAAKGVETQTRKLFEVCRMRGTPIVTFVNKLDRPARDPMELKTEVEDVLKLRTAPVTWPVGSGDRFQGVYDRASKSVMRFERTVQNAQKAPVQVGGVEDPELDRLLGDEAVKSLREEIELLDGAGEQYDQQRFLNGEITPVFFGSALTSFGVEPFLVEFARMCPPPGPHESSAGEIDPEDERFSGFVFKVQANMDPSHRDRIAFLRVCSGKYTGGMRVHHHRLDKEIRLARAEQMMAQERQNVDEAFTSVPRFSPEFFARVRLLDPMKRKQLQKGVEELAEEGTLQLFLEPGREKDPILGVVGELQFEVLKYRLEHEYGAKAEMERMPYQHARWVEGPKTPEELMKARIALGVWDVDKRPVALMRDEWELRRAQSDNPKWVFNATAAIGG